MFILPVLLISCARPSPRHEIIDPLPVDAEKITTIREIPLSHKRFLARFLPEIHTANNQILVQRNRILDLSDSLDEHEGLSERQIGELNALLKEYRLDPLQPAETYQPAAVGQAITHLLKRADIIPPTLVMAQAIIESGWGSSDFAREGNNYFGVHCYTEGCGVKPAANDSAAFYVKTYPTEMAGIEDYLWILNTGHAYRGLRDARLQFREEKKPIEPLALAAGLSRYSVKGQDYVNMVGNIIRNYIPHNVDQLLTGTKIKEGI